MKSKPKERLPAKLPFAASTAGETLSISTLVGMVHLGLETKDIAQWAHRLVWTDRMLETLVNDQVKGGKWPLAGYLLYGAWLLESTRGPLSFRPIL